MKSRMITFSCKHTVLVCSPNPGETAGTAHETLCSNCADSLFNVISKDAYANFGIIVDTVTKKREWPVTPPANKFTEPKAPVAPEAPQPQENETVEQYARRMKEFDEKREKFEAALTAHTFAYARYLKDLADEPAKIAAKFAELRKTFVETWHAEVRAAIDAGNKLTDLHRAVMEGSRTVSQQDQYRFGNLKSAIFGMIIDSVDNMEPMVNSFFAACEENGFDTAGLAPLQPVVASALCKVA